MLTLVLVLLCLLGSVSCVSNSKVVSDESRYPYAAVVATSEGAMLCGAALIDKEKKWFVSAGRCFTEISNNGLLSDTIVAAGSTVLSKMHGFAISKIVVHPYFSRFNYANDIALFRSDKFNLDLEPVALPDHSVEVGDFKRYATLGWGDTGVGKVSQTLAEGNVTGLTDSATFCKLMTGKEDVHRTLCGLGSKAGICAYDYGTPLIGAAEDPADDANDTLVGIGSWFNKCGGKAPALYTDVRPYVDWILHVIENDGKVNFCSSPCSNMKSLVDENGSPCVLSTGESKCTMTACQIRCPLGSLDNGKCNNECNYPTCSFDNNTCQRTYTFTPIRTYTRTHTAQLITHRIYILYILYYFSF